MKIKFKRQDFQEEAARNVVRAFEGQPNQSNTKFSIEQERNATGYIPNFGYGNAPLMLSHEAIARNVRAIQQEQDIIPIDQLEGEGVTLTIEMETGTGKTYTYIKTMYELHKHYGWSKFIIVVPSVAIREGVSKSFETMLDHFAQEYNGMRIQYFIYNSSQLINIRHFANANGLHAMIINAQAFNTSFNEEKNQAGRKGNSVARIIFSKRDSFGSRRPIDDLAQMNPILIIDEPQSVLGANANNATRKGLMHFNPLLTLLYSATHREVLNMVYRLDAIDAYNRKLVKKIEVKGIRQLGDTATNGYLYLNEIVLRVDRNPQARISYDTIDSTGELRQVTRLVDEGFDLYEESGHLEEYSQGYTIQSIDGRKGIILLLNGLTLYEGDALGKENEDLFRRTQIRETIKTHLERERELFPRGIKVLSLFFVDHVENYRTYAGGKAGKGKYAKMFEEEYAAAVMEENNIFDVSYEQYLRKYSPEQVHNGYFSRDRKGNFINSKEKRGEGGSSDESAYNLIMKSKERLLSFEEPTRFIFSHSALREGWDNPNVFQICTLKNSGSATGKRQEVGRGMRLCVNSDGVRQDVSVLGVGGVFDTNVLTIIASESYENFSKQLQREIAEVVGERPTRVTPKLFTGKVYTTEEGERLEVSEDDSTALCYFLAAQGYIDYDGKPTATYYSAKESGTLDFGERFSGSMMDIIRTIDNVSKPQSVQIENARRPRTAVFQEERFKREQFQALWERINAKTSYRVNFSSEELVEKAAKALDKQLEVSAPRFVVEEGHMESIHDKQQLVAGEAIARESAKSYHVRDAVRQDAKFDLIGQLVDTTGLTRKTLVAILKNVLPATFAQFRLNPEEFIRRVGIIINDEKAMTVIEKISYERTNNTYDVSVFTDSIMRGRIGDNAIESKKSLYDLVVVDSKGVEKRFAEELESHREVEVYTKLPHGFYINTPMGHYNPDWAIAFNEGTVRHIYFVAETKGTEWEYSQLRSVEKAKIECAKRHFKALAQGGDIKYGVVNSYKALYDKVLKG